MISASERRAEHPFASRNTQHLRYGLAYLEPEVSYNVTSWRIGCRHDVKEKGLDVEVQRFVVQKELCQKTEALAVLLVAFATDLEDGDGLFAVDLVARRMVPHALGRVTFQLKKTKRFYMRRLQDRLGLGPSVETRAPKT